MKECLICMWAEPYRKISSTPSQDTVEALKETLDVLEETKEDVSDEEMIEIVSSLIEKLQQIEDKYYYTLDLDSYLLASEDDEYED